MPACSSCHFADGFHAGPDCPIRKFNAGMSDKFAAGCNLHTVSKPPIGPQTSPHALQRPEPVMHDAKPAKLEKTLQRQSELELSRRGIWFLHLSPKARERAGTPDLLFSVRSKACACELKAADGKVSADQERCHVDMRANGWTVIVCRSFEQFKHFLEEMNHA